MSTQTNNATKSNPKTEASFSGGASTQVTPHTSGSSVPGQCANPECMRTLQARPGGWASKANSDNTTGLYDCPTTITKR